jgi:HAMP domain-containing protein
VSRLPLRLRVALASAAGILLAVAALGFAAQFLVGHQLRASQDRGLRAGAGDVARISASAPALLTTAGALDSPSGGQALLVEVLDRHRRIVARSAALGGRLLPTGALVESAIRSGRSGYTHARLSGDLLRVFVAPLPDAGGPAAGGAVIVAAGVGEIDRTANHVRTLILLCALGAAGLGAAITAVLTRRGLAPLRRLSAAATDIERTGDPTRRLPAAGSGGEIGELTRTLNAMLVALDQARGNERRFLADASHELRTPVATLRGNIEYLGRHGADAETIADLQAEAERLSRLVDNLLVLERQSRDGGRPRSRCPRRDRAGRGGRSFGIHHRVRRDRRRGPRGSGGATPSGGQPRCQRGDPRHASGLGGDRPRGRARPGVRGRHRAGCGPRRCRAGVRPLLARPGCAGARRLGPRAGDRAEHRSHARRRRPDPRCRVHP